MLSERMLRRFEHKDLNAVIEINRVCLPENYASYFFIDNFNNCPSGFLVSEIGASVVGYIMCRLEHGFSEIHKLRFARKGHVISVAVLPEYRMNGIATALVNEVEKAIAELGCEEVYLEVRTTNTPAIRLYQRLNFDTTRTIAHYYFDGSDANVMAKELTKQKSERVVN